MGTTWYNMVEYGITWYDMGIYGDRRHKYNGDSTGVIHVQYNMMG
jgi:hypothetical protein